MSKWQNIDTAPRDGRLVLGIYADIGDQYITHAVIIGWRPYPGAEPGDRMSWRDEAGHVYRAPSHWAPLPEKPGAPDVREIADEHYRRGYQAGFDDAQTFKAPA